MNAATMLRTAENARYNAPIPVISVSRVYRASCLLMGALLLLTLSTYAENWNAPEEQLAARIAAVTGPGAVAVRVNNRSSLRTSEADEIGREVLTQLAALGVRFVKAEQAAAVVDIFLSEDLRNYIWIAEIHQGVDPPSVVMASIPRPEIPETEHEAAPIILRKNLLWSQTDRILDAAVMDGNPAHMAVLDSAFVTLYKFHDDRWQREQSLPINHSHPWPRDLRGRLVLRSDHLFDAYLPGIYCKSAGTAPLNLSCNDSDDPWPIGLDPIALNAFFTPSRNFFTGALAPGLGKHTAAPPFYTAAVLPRERYTLWLFAAVDGRIHLLDGMTDQAAGKLDWGSDIASIRTGCGSGWQLLVSGAGESSKDTVRAFEIPDREPVATSEPLEFNGNITALWTHAGETAITAVLRNSDTQAYEAYRINVNCGRR
jgi:hypothetical protein